MPIDVWEPLMIERQHEAVGEARPLLRRRPAPARASYPTLTPLRCRWPRFRLRELVDPTPSGPSSMRASHASSRSSRPRTARALATPAGQRTRKGATVAMAMAPGIRTRRYRSNSVGETSKRSTCSVVKSHNGLAWQGFTDATERRLCEHRPADHPARGEGE